MDDIVLIQASGVENDSDIQDLKVIGRNVLLLDSAVVRVQTTCKIKRFIVYRYVEEHDTFYDVTTTSSKSSTVLKKTLRSYLSKAAHNMQ